MPLRGHNFRGFPFEEEESPGAWSSLAARHPDIAARLRQRPAAWARKRRPSSQDPSDDFGDDFGGFDRFPFDDIPPEFREHFPSRWNRRFGSRDEAEPQPHPPQPHTPPEPPSPHQQATSTQTEQTPGPSHDHTYLPQYGLRNTVDLGQKSPADPSLVDAEERGQRSMSAPPDNRANQNPSKMSEQNHHEQPHNESSNVRHIPIFVEGRDEPVINKNVDHGEPKPAYAPPPQPHPHPHPHVDREQYFADDGPVGFHAPPNFSRAFGTPFNTFRQGPQPFAQQKVYPQTAFARGASPQRSQSPKPNFPEEKFVKVPVHHEFSKGAPSKPKPPQQQQQTQPPRAQQPPPQQKQQTPPRRTPEPPQQEQAPPQPKPQPAANDPISQILSIQTDVLNLMTDVENFTGTKKDKKYMFLDEMLTRNLIKLDTIETEGKENIRQARKEAIKCIQKCIAVLEAKADNKSLSTPQPQEQQASPLDVEMNENSEAPKEEAPVAENGVIEMKETKEVNSASQVEQKEQPKAEEQKAEPAPANESEQPQAVDTRPEDKAPEDTKTDEPKNEETKKTKAKNVKKRDKSKDNKSVDSNKQDNVEVMQVDDKGDKTNSQTMDVDSATSQ
ncbi:BAG domain-containing protein Samui isoform X2 [Plodia interpunctella]|uniref:BAG domain-containing protein Samui isoform X2 n=1 Tax=Plodia interpunctella TaxID=58824 RepID=UPI002368E593|nr:BAG domain-containing protein Samui isoform X2 [Plodia interpunctella]